MECNTALLEIITMKHDFKVSWEIDAFNCDGPVEAAQYAQRIQQKAREGYNVGVFSVIDSAGNRFTVDLDESVPEAVEQ